MFSIGKEMNKPRGSGKRKKIGKLIPVYHTLPKQKKGKAVEWKRPAVKGYGPTNSHTL